MTRRAKRNAILFLVITVSAVGGFLAPHGVKATVWPSGVSQTSDPLAELCAVLAEDRETAYQLMRDGDPWLAAATSAISLRAIPNDDPDAVNDELIDETCASLRLAVFIMMDLMDDKTRDAFVATVLEPEVYATDALILMNYEVTSAPTLEETYVLIDTLWALADRMNPVARPGALAILANPYSFRHWPHCPEARRLIAAHYPGLDITRTVMRWSIEEGKHKPKDVAGTMAWVLDKELRTDAEKAVLANDPVAMLTAAALPDLQSIERTGDGVALLCAGITGGEDWRVRYGFLNVVPGYHTGANKAQIEAAVAALAESEMETPDTVRASHMILGFAMDAKDTGTAAYWAERILARDRIFDPVDRPLHEEAWHAIEQYGDYLASRGYYEDAALAYERLAAKYPNSALAARFYAMADAIREKGR